MPNLTQLYIAALQHANWQPVSGQTNLHSYQMGWLLELGSMTKRLKSYCDQFTLELVKQYDVLEKHITHSERALLGPEPYLAREVILLGDAVPWVVARSLIPYSTISGPEKDLAELGAKPLGPRIFSAESAYRDEIEMAFVHVNHTRLLARRSRLWINNKPLLVAELFLPSAPIYFF